MREIILAAAAAFAAMVSSPAASANPILNGDGKLIGATGVNVGGTVYDVTFLDGTCEIVFGSCDPSTKWDFFGMPAATVAAQALLDQVFVGTFDEPFSTIGCGGPYCQVQIPFGGGYMDHPPPIGPLFMYQFVGAINASEAQPCCTTTFTDPWGQTHTVVSIETDRAQWGPVGAAGSDTGYSDTTVFARFSLSAVPEPATWLTMLLGFSGIGLAMRRRHFKDVQYA